MIKTRVCELLNIEHPVAIGGMGSIFSPPLVSAVSQGGGLGAMGCHRLTIDQIKSATAEIRQGTNKPFALNFLLFDFDEACFQTALDEGPSVMAFAWSRPEHDLKHYFDRAHQIGAKVTYMVGSVEDAVRGAEAGADVIIAQGTDGGGHVHWVGTLALVPMVVDAVAPIPVLAAGGIADGRGLAASLSLGAEGVLLGTRFLASDESPLHPNFKQAIVDSDGHDTVLTEIPDIAQAIVWPGGMSRARRNRFIRRWAGREWELRQHQSEALAKLQEARRQGDIEEAPLSMGQDAGLITEIMPAGEIISRMVEEAENILSNRLPGLLG
ncbi:MAG: nitronate monooxygenase [Rhodospirillaceae bacterium]|jgi:NAD(P)H-dependent flavin oxidoreductase YrpB (nitropropane dioxygenase family)|nr:nitronate monooxygenase [Rhodospirillaceae bacterium]MBT5049477.1 nitronate monooxygenase [Rhodospirillaceae bacterium]MBT5455655.1 nitronate monooxygenase [Rhodospirillaceae bacterium]